MKGFLIKAGLVFIVQMTLLFSSSQGLKCFSCEFMKDEDGNIVEPDGTPADDYGRLCYQQHASMIWDSTNSTKDWYCYEFTAMYKGKLEFVERDSDFLIDDKLIGTCVNQPDLGESTNRRKCYCRTDVCNVNLSHAYQDKVGSVQLLFVAIVTTILYNNFTD